jgi:hypothetical protein
MPETFGKRQRGAVKAQKAAAREERRLARNRRKANREAGLPEDWMAPPADADDESVSAEHPDPDAEPGPDGEGRPDSGANA